MGMTALERAEAYEKKIRARGTKPYKFLMSPELRVELEANKIGKTSSKFILARLELHFAYLRDHMPESINQMTLFNMMEKPDSFGGRAEHIDRAYAFEQIVKARGDVPYKFQMSPEVRLELDAYRGDKSLADYLRGTLAKHCVYLGDPKLGELMTLEEYLDHSLHFDAEREAANNEQ